MNIEQLKRSFGEEYPAAITRNGSRIPLKGETRFSRCYCLPGDKTEHWFSKFMDGSASMTFAKLEAEWPTWTESERLDFCGNCSWLHEQSDFPDMIRFVMRHGGADEWSAIAMSVASSLPQNEAFDVLVSALHALRIGKTSNITQAVAQTKHPEAEATLREHLQSVWERSSLWDNDPFVNWIAFDATTCIAHLLELGAPSADFEEQVRRLSRHVCSHNRDCCRNYLSKHYSWLN